MAVSGVVRHAREAPGGVLHGRRGECGRIEALLDGARAGRSAVLLVRGEPGIGKSELLAHAVRAAGDLPVLCATGLEPESDLAFAGLHQLLRPVLDRLDSLPGPQAEAVRRAFGLADGPISNPFLISLATLTLLADVAEGRGLLCLVDDAHWLDRSSADVLLSVARRLDAEGVVLLMAARDGDSRRLRTGDLPELELGGLDDEAAMALLAGPRVDARVRARLLEISRGNPLALLELPASLTPEQLAGSAPLVEPLPIGAGVEQAFLGRAGGLSGEVQALLLVAAADDTEQVGVVCAAAGRLGIEETALDELEEAQLVAVDGPRITFRHPLVRSAVYRGAISRERRRAHLALAEVLGARGDQARRAWHRAAAAHGPDEGIAADLESAARSARRRGAHAAAAVTFERAALLSTADAARGRRLLDAAQASWRCGRADRALELLEQARPLLEPGGDTAALELLHGSCVLERGSLAHAFKVLVEGARRTLDIDQQMALRMLLRAAEASWWAGETAWSDEVSELARRLTIDGSSRALLVGSALVLRDDFAAGAAELQRVEVPDPATSDARPWVNAAAAAVYCGDEAEAQRRYGRAVEILRAQGAIGELPYVLTLTAAMDLSLGRYDAANANASEALRLAAETQQETDRCYALSLLASVAAVHGRADDCRALAAEATEVATARGLGAAAHHARWALGRLELGDGRPAEALAHFALLGDFGTLPPTPLVSLLATPDIVEAAVRVGEPKLATERLERFARWAEAMRSHSWSAAVARLRGLLADGPEANAWFERAIEQQRAARRPFELARSRLLYGEHLRRSRRRIDARVQLRAAQTGFEALGATGWAERASAELRASGETARRAAASARVELTPQELQIARFVIEGASNREVAAKLFVSRRTVEHHLSKVFAKLGIASRVELARALAEHEGAAPG
jgi:DNA-binding CsgD family transcriptional regulator